MAALNRAIPLKHRSTFWTTVNQIISTFQSDNFNIAFNQFHAVGQIRWTACGLVRLGGCSNRTYQQLRCRFTCVTGPTCMVRYERKLTWLTYGLSKQHHSKTSKNRCGPPFVVEFLNQSTCHYGFVAVAMYRNDHKCLLWFFRYFASVTTWQIFDLLRVKYAWSPSTNQICPLCNVCSLWGLPIFGRGRTIRGRK